MNANRSPVDMDEVFRNPEPITRALREAFLEAIDLHIGFGKPMVFWEDGKIVHYPPERLVELKAKTLANP